MSDIHANYTALEAVLRDAGDADETWCLGDLVGYGPDPNAVVEEMREIKSLTCLILLLCGGAALGSVVDVLSVHPRTVNRQLKDQGTSYRVLRDQCRHALASVLLRETDLSVAELAARLDYADTASFTRAFRRWTGQPPALWRSAQPPR